MDDLPPPIKLTSNPSNFSNSSNNFDDPLFEAKINNPFSKFFNWIKSFLRRNQNITIKIPILGILIALSSFSLGLGSGYNWGFNTALARFFPDSSPVFQRAITSEGVIEKSSSGKFYLKSKDQILWTLKAVNSGINFADFTGRQVTIKGNLTKEKLLIEVSEIIPSEQIALLTEPAIPPPSQTFPTSPNTAVLPALYSGLQWETNQKKLLIFTSGKRKIEQEGVYLESVQVSTFPQDFINYYLEGLKSGGFKETLNSINPEGITITYAQNDLFLTFGIKNIYKGSRSNNQLVGYKAYLEHN
ncbi:MAG: hypothetical protein ACD_38C00086G0009 [uncultured bacterium]|uniref:Uncharacterized protein n=1 Tax=Candidatus Daviesbacteria bacterium GW2011_GWC2_40_12 TaxID=1618431 RepID=A0A0G0QXA2_9BACT|nr:MAG: hypothetical protein ACD_38C00086G0009 [uncultured bacterium]KKQ84959.1 MAG: hypothetical protein UT04_C0009G0003 [Candidatus Daviesbacteria bacterium GW2011_GWF2_38_7]KKR16992.1 MAG: hypothetical protein UT45_C0003G0022 [Candidatus Daviesbacteria bacterium GW2011_GWA2_39_33]KKR25437.1 MAG: hypothetical protein UT54_C0002G0020 [Candidatus Daviesbacteria bacterium GW2011_GWB1_39_5]KKR42056.1 MAG: hypothetical protein UT77_C0004G0040 [Candidatus Daviesbacteria bacterium GW2011_GWC2_40_12]